MSYKPAIASMSLGRCFAGHDLAAKFQAAHEAGLSGIEMFYEDLVDLATSFPSYPAPTSFLEAAQHVRELCEEFSLPVMGLGPFSNYEGLLCPTARSQKLAELNLWFDMCRILGTNIIQIPSTFSSANQNIGDLPTIIQDLREIADIGAVEGFRFAFENLCFGTHIDSWGQAWAVVKGVDRENFGLCLDTFNIAGREFADPASITGKVPDAETSFKESLARMVREIDPKKVFYIQVVDAERLMSPLDENHSFYVQGQKARMSWSRNCRLFLGEKERGAYLPVLDVLKAVCEGLGYTGWVSMELFNRSLLETDSSVPIQHAERAMESWAWVCEQMNWEQSDKAMAKKMQMKPQKFPDVIEMEIDSDDSDLDLLAHF